MVCTSPPYWGLRDYQVRGQIGLEPTPEEYVATMVAVFREVRRVLKDDGTVWLNLGDSYCGSVQGVGCKELWAKQASNQGANGARLRNQLPPTNKVAGLKPKDLIGMPWRVAFALQADGWYLRSDIIWSKANPMPESVTDRPTRSHEYLFLLAKRAHYYYDADAIREPYNEDSIGRYAYSLNGTAPTSRQPNGDMDRRTREAGIRDPNPAGRNKRDVWTINSEPTPEAHFATFPQALVTPCILAGTSAKGECVQCGANWVRDVQISGARGESWHDHVDDEIRGQRGKSMPADYARTTTGWRAQCSCNAPVRPNLVFDPFLGSGTVGIVAERLGRRWVGTELSWDYIKIAQNRTRQMGLFATSTSAPVPTAPAIRR